MQKIISTFMLCDVYNVLTRRQTENSMPEEITMSFIKSMMTTSGSSSKEALFNEHADVYTKIIRLLFSAGLGNSTLSKIVAKYDQYTVSTPPQIAIDIGELDQVYDGVITSCAGAPKTPVDIYDREYLNLPVACQTMFDSVSPRAGT